MFQLGIVLNFKKIKLLSTKDSLELFSCCGFIGSMNADNWPNKAVRKDIFMDVRMMETEESSTIIKFCTS